MLGEEGAYAGLERGVAHEILELLQDRWSLVVDDRAIVALGLVEVGELLPERTGPIGLVDGVRRRLGAEVERLPRVRRWIDLIERLGRHERGEPLLEPEIVEPAHGHEIAEPLMGHFVQDGREAIETLRQSRSLAEDESVFIVEDGARMLHPSKRERRCKNEVELLEWKRATVVALHPVQRTMIQVEQGVEVGFRGAGAPDVCRNRAAIPRRGGVAPWPGSEGDEIRADRLGLIEARRHPITRGVGGLDGSVGDDRPARRRGQCKADPSLQVGLIEAGEELIRIRRNEQGVEVVAAVGRVMRANDACPAGRDVGGELEVERVLPRLEQLSRNDEVTVPGCVRRDRVTVDRGAAKSSASEVEYGVSRVRSLETDADSTHRAIQRRHVEREIIADVVYRRGAMAGEAMGDADIDLGRRVGNPSLQHQHGPFEDVDVPKRIARDDEKVPGRSDPDFAQVPGAEQLGSVHRRGSERLRWSEAGLRQRHEFLCIPPVRKHSAVGPHDDRNAGLA